MRVLLMRHGQTTLNVDKKFYGDLDPDLTELGEEQAREIATMLKVNGLCPEAIFTSDSRRTRNTVGIICNENNWQDIRIEVDRDFNEKSFGRWEGLNADEIEARFPDEWWNYIDEPLYTTPKGAEPYANFVERIDRAFYKMLKTSFDNAYELIVFVCHNGVLRDLSARFLENEKEYWDIYYYHGNIYEYALKSLSDLAKGNTLRKVYQK